jgi:hypothetical protein
MTGDGQKLYSAQVGGGPMFSASEDADTVWTAFNDQTFAAGSFEFALDATNGILYSASWGAGIWALKLP